MRLKIISDIDSELLQYIYNAFEELKASNDKQVDIDITSYGGDVFAGIAICEKIKEFQELEYKFNAYIYGVAASAAADIALCCDYVEMAESSGIMVHAAYRLDGKKDKGLDIANRFQLNAIQKRNPDFSPSELKQDSWFTSYEALQNGLVDGVFNVSTNDIYKENARLSRQYIAKYESDNTFKYAAYGKDFVNSTEFLGDNMQEVAEIEKIEKIKKQRVYFAETSAESKEVQMEEEQKKEIVEEKKEVAEDQIDVSDLIERISERLKFIEDRLDRIEKGGENAECGREERQAKFKALYDKLGAICAPAQRPEVVQKETTPEEDLQRMNAKYPNLADIAAKLDR